MLNPVNGNYDEIVISGTYGLGTSIVDGDENGDLFIYNKKTKEIKKEIRTKKIRQVLDFENKKVKIEEINIEDEVLNDSEVQELVVERTETQRIHHTDGQIGRAHV